MLFNEPKLLKLILPPRRRGDNLRFSALQRAEIAEIAAAVMPSARSSGFSALQRAEIAEIVPRRADPDRRMGFSALQRAEIAEI